MSTRPDLAINLQQLVHRYDDAAPVLDIESFQVNAGERLFLAGPSGSGKSTLLSIIAGILPVQQGQAQVLGQSLQTLGGAARDRLRADRIGFVFQMFNLLPYLDLVDNVLLSCRFSRARAARVGDRAAQRARAAELLQELGMGQAMTRRDVGALSVGQQQRVALARALIGAPDLIICDEPTSALDSDSRGAFIELLHKQLDSSGATLVFVSHDQALAPLFSRQAQLREINRAVGS